MSQPAVQAALFEVFDPSPDVGSQSVQLTYKLQRHEEDRHCSQVDVQTGVKGTPVTLSRNKKHVFVCPHCRYATGSKPGIVKHVRHCDSGKPSRHQKTTSKSQRGVFLHDTSQPLNASVPNTPMPPKDTPAPRTSTPSVDAPLEVVDCAHALQAPMDVDHQPDNRLPSSANTGLIVSSTSPNSTLLNLDLRIEPNLQIIYCITCQEAIKPTSVRGHILTHFCACPPNDKLQEILSEYNLDSKVRMPSAPITRIPGLRHGKGYKCLECGFLRPSTRSIRTHCRDVHPGKPKEFLETTAHIIYEFRGDMVLVETNPDLDGLPQGSAYEAYRAARPVQPPPQKKTFQAPKDPREASNLLSQMKWDKDIDGCDIAQLRALVAHPDDDVHKGRALAVLGQEVGRYIKGTLNKVVALPVLVLRYLNTPTAGAPRNMPFRKPQTNEYIQRVILITTCLLAFIYRSWKEPTPNFHVPLSRELQEACESYENAVASGYDLLQFIHQWFWAFLTTKSDEMTLNDRLCTMKRFLVLYFLKADGSFIPVEFMPPDISKILMFLRCGGCYDLLDQGPGFEGGYMGVYEAVLKNYLTDGTEGVFTSLMQEFHLLSALSYRVKRLPRFSWNHNYSVVSMDGYPITMSDLQEFPTKLLKEADVRLHVALQGLKFRDFDKIIAECLRSDNPKKWIKDDLRNQEPGYSFLTDTRNSFHLVKDWFLKELMDEEKNPQIAGDFFFRDRDGRVHFKQSRLHLFFCQTAEFYDVVYPLVKSTEGGDTRGTEMICQTIVNTQAAPRTLYSLSGYLGLINTYSKTRHNKGWDKLVARFPAPEVVRLLLYIVALIRPLEVTFAEEIYGEEAVELYKTNLWVRKGKRMDVNRFSDCLRNFTDLYLCAPLGVSDWRQLMKTFFRHVLHVNLDAEEEGDQQADALLSMFGHEEETTGRAHYGLEYSHLAEGFDEASFARWLRGSIRLHYFQGLATPEGVVQGMEADQELVYVKLDQLMGRFNGVLKTIVDEKRVVELVQTELRDAMASTFQPAIQKIITEALSPYTPRPRKEIIQITPPVTVHPQRLEVLRDMLRNPAANFKSPQQAEMFELVCQGRQHVVAVLPTGGGKSLALFGPPMFETGVTVVITPLVSVHQEHFRKAPYFGVWASDYPSKTFRHDWHKLLLCPVHKASEDSFFTMLKGLKNANSLNRIIFDEVHHFLVDGDFRHCFELMCKFSELHVQLVFLSATLPPGSLESLFAKMYLDPSSVAVVRADTCRLNIAYDFIQADHDHILEEVKIHMLLEEEDFSLVDRGIAFCQSVDVAKVLAEMYGVPYYIGPMEPHEKQQASDNWREGKVRWIVATSAFSEGVDYPHVRTVISVEAPRGILEFDQMTGRAGRDGQPSNARLFYSRVQPIDDVSEPDHLGRKAMHRLLTIADQCARIDRGIHFDGHAHTCQSLPGALQCSRCCSLGKSLPAKRAPYVSTLALSCVTTPKLAVVPLNKSAGVPAKPLPFNQASGPTGPASLPAMPLSPFTPSVSAGTVDRSHVSIAPCTSFTGAMHPTTPLPHTEHPAPTGAVSRSQASIAFQGSASKATSSIFHKEGSSLPSGTQQLSSPVYTSSGSSGIVYNFQDHRSKCDILKKLLNDLEGHCPICWFSDGGLEPHHFFRCEKFGVLKADYGQFQAKLQLPQYELCYLCLVPQTAPFSHVRPQKGQPLREIGCKYRDILKPLVFMILRSRDASEDIYQQLHIAGNHRSPEDINGWFGMKAVHPSLSHILEFIVIHIYWKWLRS